MIEILNIHENQACLPQNFHWIKLPANKWYENGRILTLVAMFNKNQRCTTSFSTKRSKNQRQKSKIRNKAKREIFRKKYLKINKSDSFITLICTLQPGTSLSYFPFWKADHAIRTWTHEKKCGHEKHKWNIQEWSLGSVLSNENWKIIPAKQLNKLRKKQPITLLLFFLKY